MIDAASHHAPPAWTGGPHDDRNSVVDGFFYEACVVFGYCLDPDTRARLAPHLEIDDEVQAVRTFLAEEGVPPDRYEAHVRDLAQILRRRRRRSAP